ncbi:MAG: hypothetical protein RJA98_2460, partial [Pseudomonadota bacterium]
MTSARPPHHRPVLEAFEPRILYAADLAAVALPFVGVGAAAGAAAVLDQRLQSTAAVQQVALHEIAFVDAAVPDAATLIAGLQAQREAGRPIEVWRIEAGQDGVALIGQVLAQQASGSVSAVHVFSHGSVGAVQLGSARLDADSALARAAEIAAWGPALTADADLLLYGCNVAAGDDSSSGSSVDHSGHGLLNTLAALSGADVAASDDATGSAALGGDWLLEQHTGTIDTAVAPSLQTQALWAGTLGADLLVNTTLSGQQDTLALNRGSQQAVALDASGNFVVVWTSKDQDGDGDGVYARRFAADGTALTGEIRVNASTAGDQNGARVVSDSAGNFVVVWTSDRSDGSATTVMLRRFNASGVALTGERQVAVSGGAQADPVLAINSSTGAFTVAWSGNGPGDSQGIFFRRFSATAAAIDTADQRANSSNLGSEQNTAIAMDSSGRFVISWDVSDRVYVQRFNASGVAQGSATQVGAPLLAGLLSSGSGAALAMDEAGHYAIAYREKTALYVGVWTATYNADGSLRSGWLLVDGSADASNASVDMADDGSSVVVYDKSGVAGSDVYLRRYLADGSASGSAELVNAYTGNDQGGASVSVHSLDHMVVVWHGKSTGDSKGVVAKLVLPAGSAPTIGSDGGGNSASLTLNEGVSAVTTVTATDPDLPAQSLRYAIVGGDDAARFTLNERTGALSFVAPPNYESPADADANNRYQVTVQASDGARVDSQEITVNVSDVNEFAVSTPVDWLSWWPDRVSEFAAVGTFAGVALWARDADGSNNTVRYTLTDSAGGRFSIGASDGVVRVAGPLDYELASSHSLTALATSSDGSSAALTFTIAVVNENDGGVGPINDSDTAAEQVLENAAAGTPVGLTAHALDADAGDTVHYSLLTIDDEAAASNGRFTIDAASGVVSVGSVAPDAESRLAHKLVVQASSSDGTTVQQDYTINVLDDPLEHALGAVTDSDLANNSVREDAALGSAVGLTAQASDADVTLSGVRYALLGTSAPFAIDAQTGQVTLARSVEGAAQSSWRLTVIATSDDGSTAQQSFDVSLLPVNSQAPVITSDGGAPEVALAVDEGTLAVTRVQAVDADLPTPTLSYTLAGGADAAAFVLDASSGELRFARAPDAEAPGDALRRNVYEVVVRASDGERTAEQTLHITVRPVNDNTPRIISDGGGAEATLTVDENQTAVSTVQARDADLPAATLRYAVVGGADGDRFSMDAATGVLRFVSAADFEAPADANGDGQFDVVVRASDGELSSDQTLHVRLRDVNEAPTLLRHALTISEGGSAVPDVLAQDGDSPPEALRYSVQNLSGGRFEALAAPGVALLSFTQADVNAGRVRFVSDGGEVAPAYQLALSDGVNTLAAQAASVSYTRVDDAPQAADVDLGDTLEDTPCFITRSALLAGASDAENDPLTLSDVHLLAGEGVLTDLGGGVWRFDPGAQWSGAVSLGYRIDDGWLAATGTARLAVRAVNDAPLITSHGGAPVVALSLSENTVTVDTLAASDIDSSGPLRYSISGGADAARFVIDPLTGALRFASAPNHEQPSDANRDNVYALTVAASDGELSASQTLSITVTNVAEAPVVSANTLLLSDGQITLVLRATDEDTAAAQLQYSVGSSTGGHFERSDAPGSVVLGFSQAEVDAGLLHFVADGSASAPSYTLSLSDGHSSLVVAAPTLVEISAPVAQPTPVGTVTEPLAPVAAATAPSTSTSANANTNTNTNASLNTATAATSASNGAAAAPAGSAWDTPLNSGTDGGYAALFSEGAPGAGPVHVPALAPLSGPDALRGPQAVSAEAGLWGDWRQAALNEASALAPAYVLGEGSGAAVRAGLIDALDRLRHAVQHDAAEPELALGGSALITTTGLSVGYALWLARGGVLVASLMSSIPSWAGMDPLPVLAQMREGDGDDADDAGGPAEIDP